MDFIEELKWRNMLQDMTPGAEERLKEKPAIGYIGFDPTAPSMTIGNFVQIMLLKLWQMSGHQPIVLMGGATGRIGDPSGKDKERELKTEEELDSNLEFQKKQMSKFLDFEGPNKALIVNNLDFYKEMNVLAFLRNVGKTLTVNYMMSKDSVKNRLESGLSFTEFSYQLLQAFDFQCLYEDYNCEFQMGGSDQWGNITSGTEFIRRNSGGKAFAMTTPLLTKSDGKKFGKSEHGNIWLDPTLTSPYQFYQFWINADDADIPTFFRYFTLKSKEEVLKLEKDCKDDPRKLKNILAEELTTRVHSPEACQSAMDVSEMLFNRKANAEKLKSLSADAFQMIAGEIITFSLPKNKLADLGIIDLLAEETDIIDSKSNARKAIKNNAVSVNKVKINNHDHSLNANDLIHNRFMMIENGKKNKYLIVSE